MVEANFPCSTTNQKHCPDLGRETSSAWNFFAGFSDFISRFSLDMSVVYSSFILYRTFSFALMNSTNFGDRPDSAKLPF